VEGIDYLIDLDIDFPTAKPTPITLNMANLNSVRFIFKVWRNAKEINYLEFSGCEANFLRPDRLNVVGAAALASTGITYQLDQALLDIPGVIMGYLTLFQNDVIVATLYFTFRVVSDLINSDDIKASYIARLEDLIKQAQAMLDDIGGGLVPWPVISQTPTNLAGYGITDAVSKAGDTMTGPLDIQISNLNTFQGLNIKSLNNTLQASAAALDASATYGCYTDVDNYNALQLNKSQADTTNGIMFVHKINGVNTSFTLWGNHNLPVENGSWTATASAGFTIQLNTTLYYHKIGKLVFITGYLTLAKASGTTNDADSILINGLPFPVESGNAYASLAVGYSMSSTGIQIRSLVTAGGITLHIAKFPSGYLTVGELTSNLQITFSGCYSTTA